ncbi:alpha/beta fold hydrolase [Urechidicola croceus]|uniref:Alpha/beta hydrolase n=1 Tax=Urechidicola croceus TaxID=1850246 RepID=A0A1D8P7V2_9FLAO|nr:alpha/beta fold hydrolase [Urechidicola croceus]AOW20636.1 alpha/beta hydrolase [Urechidicola croceus]
MSEILHSRIIGKGEPFIILHGFLGMGDNWKTLGNKFAEHFEVHLIDQRNHGRSFHSEEFDLELLTEDLLNYLEAHNLDRVNLLGHSMGGKVAMLFAVNHPKKVKKLIIADISPRFYPPHHHEILEALNAVNFNTQKSRDEIEGVLKNYISEFGIRQFLMKNVTRNGKNGYKYRFNLSTLTENYEEITLRLPSFTQFEGDVLFLRGENSGYIGKDDEGVIEAHFPNSKIVTVKNAGHWLHADNPSDFYAEVVSFLD